MVRARGQVLQVIHLAELLAAQHIMLQLLTAAQIKLLLQQTQH